MIDLDNLLLSFGIILPLKLLSDLSPEISLALVLFHPIEESRVGEGRFSSVSLCLPHIGLVPSFQELVLCRKQTSVKVSIETLHDLLFLHLAHC